MQVFASIINRHSTAAVMAAETASGWQAGPPCGPACGCGVQRHQALAAAAEELAFEDEDAPQLARSGPARLAGPDRTGGPVAGRRFGLHVAAEGKVL